MESEHSTVKVLEKEELPKGFRCKWVPASSEDRVEDEVQMLNKVLMGSEFVAWDEFDLLVAKVESELCKALKQQGCFPGTRRANHCFGAFRNINCCVAACRNIASYKNRMQREFPPTPLGEFDAILLPGLMDLASRLKPGWTGKDSMESIPPITQEIPDPIAICRPDQRCPDFVIEVRDPIRTALLPVPRDRKSLASAYNDSCESIMTDSELSYHQRHIAKTIKFALFTRSGYGCLFCHNQAVFLKVCPDITEARTCKRAVHKVLLSREFKCDEDISVPYGLLTAMLHANEDSNEANEKSLKGYFRLLEASEAVEPRTLVIEEHCGDQKKRSGYVGSGRDDDDVHRPCKQGRSLGLQTLRELEQESERKREPDSRGTGQAEESEEEEVWIENDMDWDSLYPTASELAQEKVRRAIEGGEYAVLNEVDMIRMFITRSKFLDTGGSGTVLVTCVEGMKVAVKRWHWRSMSDDEGLLWLTTEILVYKMLARENPEVIGSVVPRLIAICENPMKESVLVTEYVGSELLHVFPDKNGGRCSKADTEEEKMEPGWYVDGVKLTEKEINAIDRNASAGLRELRRCGIIHADPESKNLRVQKVKDKGGVMRWRTWWIDLGCVRVPEAEKLGDLTVLQSQITGLSAAALECYDPKWREYELQSQITGLSASALDCYDPKWREYEPSLALEDEQ